MRALVTRLRDDHIREKTLVTDWPEPEGPEAHEIKARTLYSGVTNGTERNDLTGGNYATPDDRLPAGWGYQNVGQIVEVGSDVTHLEVGNVIYISADHMEYAVIPEAGLLIKLPAEVDPKHAALFGMASVAMRSCRNADPRMGERILIVGQGCIGQFAAQIAHAMGARVTVCDVDTRRLNLARKVGAAEMVLDTSGDGWADHIEEAYFDAVIDLAGVVDMEDQLIKAVRHKGRVVLVAGRFKVNYTFNLGQGKEITLKQNSHFDNSDLAEVCHLVARGSVHIGPIIQEIIPVSDAKRLYDTLRDTSGALMGTVFEW